MYDMIREAPQPEEAGEIDSASRNRPVSQGRIPEAEALFYRLADTSAAAIFVFQESGYRYVNTAAEVITGYTREELLAMNVWQFAHPEFQELLKERGLARLRGDQVPSRYECKIITKSGEERWIEVAAGTIDWKGSLAGVITAYDFTARKQAEEQSSRLASYLEEGPYPRIEVDGNGSLTYLNAAARREFPDLAQAGLKHPILQAAKLVLAAQSPQQSPVFVPEIAWGDRLYEQQITSKGDRLRVYVMDITELRRIQDQLQASRERLRTLYRQLQMAREQERTQIARKVHDELGQVLAYVKLSLSRLAGQLPRSREAIRERIEEIAQVLHRTVQSVREVYSELRPAVMDVLELKSALQWQTRKFRVRKRVPTKLVYQIENVSLDEKCCTAVFRIYQEILNHVAEHTTTSTVHIEVKQDEGHAVLAVGYHGNPSGETETYQIETAALREFVLALGGELHVQENPPKGNLISVRVPIRKTKSNWAHRAPHARARPRRRKQ